MKSRNFAPEIPHINNERKKYMKTMTKVISRAVTVLFYSAPCQIFWWTCALILLSSNVANSQLFAPGTGVTAHAFAAQDVLDDEGVPESYMFDLDLPMIVRPLTLASASVSYTDPSVSAQSYA